MEKILVSLFTILILTLSSAKAEEIFLKENSNDIIFGNSLISLHFSKADGFLRSLIYQPLNLQIIGRGDSSSTLDIRVDGQWLVEKLAIREALKNKSVYIEGKWRFALDPENVGLQQGWHKVEFDDSKWDEISLPGTWEKAGYTQVFPSSPSPTWSPYNGFAFFRRKVFIPKEWKDKELLIYLGSIDDFDWVYFNGELIGHTGDQVPNWWETPRHYVIPPNLVKFGEENTISLRVYDRGGEGGVMGPIFLIKKDDWDGLGNPIKLVGYEVKNEGKGKKLIVRSGIGDWILENHYTIFPGTDVVLREGRIVYNGSESPHISDLRFSLDGVLIGDKEDCWWTIPSNFPPKRYRFEQEGRTISDDYSWSSNRCVLVRNDGLGVGLLTIFYSETEGASAYIREGKDALDIVHTLSAADVMKVRKELEGGTQIIRVIKGDLEDMLKKEREIYDIIGLTPPPDRPDWARKAIIYSAYPGGTMDGGLQDVGGFDNFSNYLPHLADIGFNVLWLLPVWPGLYGPTDYYKIEETLGGIEGARRFIEKAHKLGLKVLFDLIPHGPREESGLLEKLPEAVSRDENGKVIYWWGCLSCDYASVAWQKYMAEHAAYWVRELDVDGYRVDCGAGGPANWDPNSPHRPTLSGLWGGLQILSKSREEMKKYKSEIMLLPEATGPWFFRYSDVVYDFPFMFICQDYSRHPRDEWIRWFQEWLEYEKYAYPKGATLMRFVESHDTVRFAGLNGQGSFNAFLALCALIEGAPMVYHDGEIGRSPFLKHIYKIRKENEELSIGEAHYLAVEANDKNVFTCLRVLGDRIAVVAINMSGQEKEVELRIGKRYIPTRRDLGFYEVFEGRAVKAEWKKDNLSLKLSIGPYSPAIILIRKEKPSIDRDAIYPPIESAKKVQGSTEPSFRELEGNIIVENETYKAIIDTNSGMLKYLSTRKGENWIDDMVWEEGKRRLGIGERLSTSGINLSHQIERGNGEVFVRFTGYCDWARLGILYRFDQSRIDVLLSLHPTKEVGLMKGELWHWFKLKGVQHWFVNTLEANLYDEFYIRHFKETKGGRYWHTPYLFDSSRCPLNPYYPLISAIRGNEYLAILLPPFYTLPENIYIREKLRDEGFHILLSMADGRNGWKIAPGEVYEMRYSILIGKGGIPIGEPGKDLPLLTCDGANYLIETSHYKAVLSRRNGQVNNIISRGKSLLQGAEIYSDRGIYGEYYDSLGNAFSLIGTSNNDPEVELAFQKEDGKIRIITHSFLREGNSGWNNVARPLVEYQAEYEFKDKSPSIGAKIKVRPFVEKQTTAFLAQRLDFKEIKACYAEGQEISLQQTGRVWESRNYQLEKANIILRGDKAKIELKVTKIPEGGNLFIYNSGNGDIIVFFAYMDGDFNISPKWYEFSYEMGCIQQ
ncbi:hypothetical protein H5T87_01525 [bacterium]|nr:hypothetical protein [bacterium]